jgi:hypothetical protein
MDNPFGPRVGLAGFTSVGAAALGFSGCSGSVFDFGNDEGLTDCSLPFSSVIASSSSGS